MPEKDNVTPNVVEKKYIVKIGGAPKEQIWDAEKYERNRNALLEDYGEDVEIYEVAPYNGEAVNAGDAFSVHIPGTKQAQIWDADRYARNRETLAAEDPGAEVERVSPVDYWGEQRAQLDSLDSQIAELEGTTKEAQNQWNLLRYNEFEEGSDEEVAAGTKAKNLEKELDELCRKRENNPVYKSTKKAIGVYLEAMQDNVKSEAAALNEKYAPELEKSRNLFSSSREAAIVKLQMPAEYTTDSAALQAARMYYDDAIKVWNAPSRYGKESGFANFFKGLIGEAPEALSVVQLTKAIGEGAPLIEVVNKIHEHEGENVNIINLIRNEPDKLDYLSPAQKSLLNAFITKSSVDAARSNDLSLGYQAGQTAMKSLGFMADFLLTGGIGDAAVKGATKGIIKRAAKGLTKIENGALRTITKEASKFGIGTLQSGVKTLAISGMMPSTYANVINNLTNLNDAGDVDLSGRAVTNAIGDALIENLSESAGTQVEAILGMPFRAIGATGAGKLFANTEFGAWAKALKNAPAGRIMKQAAWNGLIGEIGEEWYGNALRVLTGVDPDALKNFATAEQQIITWASFAPMSILGGGASIAQYEVSKKQLDNAGKYLRQALANAGYDGATIDNVLAAANAENPTELAKGLAPVIVQTANDNVSQSNSVFKAVLDYAGAASKYRTYGGFIDADMSEKRQAMSDEISAGMGVQAAQEGKAEPSRPWVITRMHQIPDGSYVAMNSVRVVTDKDGVEYFVQSESEDGSLAAIDRQGNPHIISSADLVSGTMRDTGEMPLNDYLDRELTKRRLSEDEERVQSEFNRNRQNLLSRATPGTPINLGTVEAPKRGTIIAYQAGKFIVQDENGVVTEAPEEQMSHILDVPYNVETEEKAIDREVSDIERREELRTKANAVKGVDVSSVLGLEGHGTLHSVSLDNDGNLIANIRIDEDNVITKPVSEDELASIIALGEQNSPAEVKEETEVEVASENDNEVEEQPADDTPRDFHGNPLPMRTNKKGEQVVDETALWNNDPEAWCHYNDANPEQIVTSVEKLEYAAKELAKQATAAEKTMKKAALKGTTQDEIEDLRDDYKAKKDRLAVLQGILAEYKKPAEPAQTFAGEQRKAEASKKKEAAMAGFPGIQQRWGEAMKIDGAPDELTLANGEVVVGHYVLTDAMAMTPSHNPAMGFTMSDGFPVDENGRTVNDRDYERDKGAQAAVNEKAKDYDQRALQAPVIVSNDGVVLSGNDRTMSSQIAAQAGTDVKYVNYLFKYSSKYGFTAEQVAAIPHPRVVFVPDESMEYTASNFAKFNADDKKSQNKTEKAVKAGKTISPNALGKIATLISQFEDISEFYADAEAVDALIGIMVEDGIITKEQVEAMKDGARLSGTGMDFVEAMLVGSVLDEEALRVTMKDAMIRKSVVSAIAQIITNNAIADYTLRNELSDAIVIVFNGKSSKVIKYGDSVQGFVRQGNLFGVDVIAEATVQLLADAINNKKLSLLRRVLDAYNGEASLAASGQIDLFTGETKSKEAILTDILNNLGYDIRTFDTIGRAAESAEESTAESAEGQVGEGGQTGSPVQSDAAGGEQVSETEVTPESNSESSEAESSVEGGEESSESEPENEGNQSQTESSAAQAEPSAPLTDAQKQVASELLGMSEAELEARSQELQEQKRQEPLKARAKEWEARTGVKVNAISSIDEVTNKQARKAIESGETVFGWFEPKTGTVCLYLPHVPNESEIDKTYIHEVVSHKGLRELLGEEGFNSLMDSVWNDMMSDADKADFLASVSHVKGAKLDKQRAAADEFVASYAENLDLSKPNSKWDKFVEAVREILAKIGISLKVNEKDLSTLLQASLARYEKMQGERKANAPRRSARKTNKSAVTRKPQELAVSSDVRDTIESLAKGLGYKIVWDDNIDSNGFWDSSSKTIHISRSAENPIEVVFGHEALHAISSLDGGIDSIRQLAIDIYGEKGFNDVVDTTERAYRKAGFDKDRSYYEEEALADFVGQMIGNQSMLDRICWDADHKILASIRDVIDKILAIIGMQDANMVRVRTTISAAYQRAIDNSNKPTSPQEERRFSLLRKKEVDQKSDKYYEEHKDAIPETVYAEAQASMDGIADMMLPYYDATALGNRMLPLEVYGNKDAKSTIFSNGAYGKTMENTLKCIRTLAYNKFTDDVKTELGRPLTQKESFLASQMVYDIATDPQCLYCYVSLDRKAYDEFLLRYVQQRDAILEKYRNLPVSERETKGAPHSVMASLYGDFLDGRKDTPVMQRRFDMWIDNERNGVKMITNADLATKDVRAAILNGMDESLAGQIKDAEKYAQSASWSKKDVDYISYVGELLKLSNTWIKRLTGEYGLRFYSFSEYTPAFLLENMQMVRDAALQGLNGLGYTKELDFVRVFAPTGMNINCSCYGRMGTDGTMVMDTNQGADWEEVKKLRQQYNNVGAVFVATNDKAVEWALSQDWIDIVIPFHIVRTGQDIADFYGWTNYSSQQADNVVGSARTMYISPVEHKNDKSEFLKACAKHGVTPRFSQWLDNPNYMKLVNETRLSVDETIPLQPIFDMSAAEDSWNRFVNRGGYYNGWWNIGAEDYAQAVRQVVEDIRSGKLASDVNYGRQDAPVLPAKMIAAARRKRMHGNTPLVDVFDRSGNVINKKDERAIDTNDSSDDVRFRRWYGGNSGYVGYSMSKRAAEARENGRFPKTDFMKEYGVSKRDFDELVNAGVIDNSEWHHTSKYGNKTTFYGWDIADYARIYTENKNDIKEFVEEIAKVRKSIVPSNEVNPYTYSNAQTALKDKLRVIDDSYYREMRKIPEWVSDEALDYYRANGWDAISEQEFHERMAELESEREQNRKAAIAEASPEDRAIYEENERYREFNSKKETPVEYEIRVDKTMKPYVEQLRDFFNSRVKEVEEDDNIIYRKRSEAAKVVATVNSSQKRAGTAYADALDMEDDILFRMSKNTRATVDNWVNKWGKAGGFDEETIEGTKSELNAQLDAIDDATTQLAFAKWFCSGRVRLGDEDMAKVEQAVKLARNHKVDPLSFSSPMEIINKWAGQTKGERIDPDTVSTLHKAKELSNGIVIYDVDESDESRENMRKIINTHFGKDCSPWCLLQGDGNGNLTKESKKYWKHYNAYPKQVVFKDGKLVAFSANDSERRVFWDREDVSHRGIPVIGKIEGDKLGRSGVTEYSPKNGEIRHIKDLYKGNTVNGEYIEYFDDSDFERIVEHYKNGRLDGECVIYKSKGIKHAEWNYKDGSLDGECTWYYSDGRVSYKGYYKDGKPTEMITYNHDGIKVCTSHYKNGVKHGEEIYYYPDGDVYFVRVYENGNLVEYRYPDEPVDDTRFRKDFTASDIAEMETPILHSKGTFKNLEEAEKWAKDNLQGKEFTNQYTGENIRISGKSISEMLAEKFVKKTNAESHKAALRSVPDFIETGIPAEVHPDYHGKGYDVMRLYSAFEFEDELYRVKSTIKRLKEGDRYYTYELQEMELVEGTQASAVGLDGNPVPSSINSISGAKLLKGVKKTNSDELILPEDNPDIRFRRGGEKSEGGSRSEAVGARGYTGDGVDWRSSSLYQREVLRETARVIGAPMELVQGTYESPAPGMVDASGRPIISHWNKGRVQICPNLCRDANDAACTYIHEAVGHSGLSSVFDQNQRRKLYLGIYNALPDAVRREVADKAVTRHGGSVVSAIKEFLSNDAIQEAKGNPIYIIEDSVNPEEYRKSVWNVVRDGLTSAFGDKGLEVSLSLNDAKWLMAQSAFPNHESNPLEEVTRQVVANHLGFTRTQQAYKADGIDALRFRRKVNFQSDSAAEIYDRAVSDAWGRLKESYVDMYQSMEEGVKAIEQTTGRPAQAFENVLLALNQQSSKALATMQRWQSTKFAPMMTAIVDLANAISGKVEDVERYVMLKHGLERNEVFAKRDALDFYQRAHDEAVKTLEKSNLEDSEKAARIAAEDAKLDMHRQEIENGTDEKYLKLRKKDYSGLTGMYMEQGGNIQRNPSETDLEFTVRLMKARYPKFVDANGDIDLAAIENEASIEVEAIEREHSNLANTLWGAINAATKATLQEQYEANLLSREQYARIRDMFKYYVPLRGFDDKTSEDFYSYYAGSSHSGYVNPIMHAEGRKSKAESPFGYIAAAESTAVAQGSKNMTKLALYYFVSNRANNDLLSVSDVWYKQVGVDQDDKPIYEAVYPNIPANATRAEVEQAVSDFEDDMKRMAKAGLAFKGKNKLSLYGGTLRPSSSKMEHEHVIPFRLAGRDMMLIVHGNPRMAQAFTGALNYNAEEGIFTKICQEALRFMASLNTQMNPEFWISNFQRDLLFSMMAVNVKEDKDYQRRYKNNLKHSIKNVIKYKKAYEKGTLGNSYEENLYKQFVENGGVTGYTVMHDNAYWERRLKEFAGEERNVVSKVVNAFKGISDFGESFEQMTRFAAFCTSVETGKDIREAIADAKNLTVNFNRKGSGKLISYEEAKKLRLNGKNVSKTGAFMIHLMSAMSPLGRRCVMFFNAAIQGLSTTWNLAKMNPAKMAGWSTLFVLIGAVNAALHAMLDDDDDYLDIPDFERRNNAMLGYNGAYLKWALPQEMRVFYGLGDMMVDHMLGRSPDKSLPVELLSAMGEVLPINPVEGILELDLPKIGKAMMPSAFTPILEIMVNEDYKGARVHNDYRYYSKEVARNIPKYRNPLPNTSKVFIGISEAANFLSGGDDVQAGWLNFDPNNIEHLFQGYTGGFGTAIGKGVHFVENTIQGEFAVRDTPFLRRLLVLNDERYRNSHTTDLYYYYKGEVENTKRILRDLKSNPDKIDRYMDFMKSEEYEVMQIFDINEKLLEYYDEEIRREEDEDNRRALMQEQDALRKEMILEISEIGKKD